MKKIYTKGKYPLPFEKWTFGNDQPVRGNDGRSLLRGLQHMVNFLSFFTECYTGIIDA